MSTARWLAALQQEARRIAHPAVPERLAAWLDVQLVRLHDPAFGQGFARSQPIPGATPADYQHRVRTLPGFGESLLGIRFRGGDRRWPFVDLLAWERLPAATAGEVWQDAVQAIAHDFARFQPRAVRLLLAEPPPLLCAAAPDLLWVTGELGALPRAPLPTGLRSRPLRATDVARVAAAYAEVPAALRPHLSPADADELAPPTLAISLETVAGGTWVGLAAARPQQSWALAGYEIVEEVLAPEWRGRGWGQALQQALIAALPDTPGAALFGTIHAQNAPSRGTARGCGRQEVARWWMLPTATDR